MTAWLDKKHGRYRIRWNDPVAKREDGTPVVRARVIKPVCTTIGQAQPHLDKFNSELPAAKPRSRVNGPAPIEPQTLLQLAMRWYDMHPTHTTRAEYVNAARKLCRPVDEGGMAIIWPGELTKLGIEEWKIKSGKGFTRRLAYLRSILHWCHEAGLTEALDPGVDAVMAAPQSGRARVRLLTPDEFKETMAVAEAHGHGALAHCMATYGWRPITTSKITVGMVDLKAGRIRGLHRKVTAKQAKAQEHAHRLLPATCQLLAPLVKGRPLNAPLFLKDGEAWGTPRGRAQRLSHWYRDYCQHLAPEAKGITAWKRWAIHCQKTGTGPWSKLGRAMTSVEAIEYTGHATPAMIDHYARPGDQDALFVIEDENGGVDGGVEGAISYRTSEQDGTEQDHSGSVVIQFKTEWTHFGHAGTR